MSDDLVQFLRARLDEDEVTARGTGVPLDWHQGPGDDPEWTSEEMVLMWPPEFHTRYEEDKHWRGLAADAELAAHIARHDPARVLADIEAKRATVAEYMAAADAMDQAKRDLDSERYQMARTEWRVLGRVLRRDAATRANHPEFREEWRP